MILTRVILCGVIVTWSLKDNRKKNYNRRLLTLCPAELTTTHFYKDRKMLPQKNDCSVQGVTQPVEQSPWALRKSIHGPVGDITEVCVCVCVCLFKKKKKKKKASMV